ncbi:MAG: hypothetical protein WCV90_03040 [Candidatus Woesearchaeota archaeon]|jgi:ribulose-phosphate 3-epimerase
MNQIIFPSLMSKNQEELDQDLNRLKGAVKILHLDIVDGIFAPNHALDFKFKLSSKFKYHLHLMVKKPEIWIKKYLSRGELFFPQIEELKDFSKYAAWMKKEHKKVGFAVLPETPISKINSFLSQTDVVLILTVHPGFYGSKYLPGQLKKIVQIKKINPQIKVIVDGGMNPQRIGLTAKAGADYFVSGSYTTKADKPKEAIKRLIKAVKE